MATVGISSSLEVSDEESDIVIDAVSELVSRLSEEELVSPQEVKIKVPKSKIARLIFFFIIDY
jgi:hypothetical protein